MKVKHLVSKVEQEINKDDWKSLQASGHAANFEVLEENDYQPDELSLPTAKPAKPVAKAIDEPKAA
ncbi:hypothetical protein [Spirosoma utsteinense]|uniref:hypothetical protein n=1 Tax=Spirosoma utsteinense TaxID=2585773 RepID=UPI0016490865|nr:hypothetical protein [Spirosoma utsteinense]MBC3785729.1 hypothetical protein [Spirosoma utsteinense]